MFGMHNLQTRPVARHFEGGADFTQLIVLTLCQPEPAYVAVRLKIVRGYKPWRRGKAGRKAKPYLKRGGRFGKTAGSRQRHGFSFNPDISDNILDCRVKDGIMAVNFC